MASNSERQARYRARHLDSGGGRINMAVSAHAEAALKRLARHRELTARATLEKLIVEAESDAVDQMSNAVRTAYFDVTA